MSLSRSERRRQSKVVRREDAARRAEIARLRQARVDPDVPQELIREIDVTLATSLAGKKFLAGETIADLALVHCPDIFDRVAQAGFVLSFALPENTSTALARGIIGYTIRRAARH